MNFGTGFDETKLNDLSYTSGKYTPALRHLAGLKDTLPPTTASLETIAADARAHGFPNAKVTGADMIDYGDGHGPIDVITDVGGAGAGWAFQNTTGNAQWEKENPGWNTPPGGAPAPKTATPPTGMSGPFSWSSGPNEGVPYTPTSGPGGSPISGLPPWLVDLLKPPAPSAPDLPGGFAPEGDAGVFLSDFLQQMGQDPASQQIAAALAGLIKNGGTPYGMDVGKTLAEVIGGGGANLPTSAVLPQIQALIDRFAAPTTPNAVTASGGSSLPTQAVLDKLRAFTGGIEGTPAASAFDPTVASGGANLPMERIMAQLEAVLSGGDTTDPAARRNRLVAARDANAGAFRGQLADARGALAERGGLSQPGVNQGPENTAIGRIAESLAPTYAGSIRDIETADMDRASANRMAALGLKQGALGTETGAVTQGMTAKDTATQSRMSNLLQSLGLSSATAQGQSDSLLKALGLDQAAKDTQGNQLLTATGQAADVAKTNTAAILDSLSLATGLSQSQAQNVLNATGQGTARQVALSNIALETLGKNQEWNKFLAEFGLNHDMVMEQLQQGRINAVVPLLQLLLTAGSISSAGYIDKQ